MDILTSMQVFIRVAERGSFTAAAEVLGHTTTHASRCVSDLERHLKTKLIHRTTRKLSLTEAGVRYLERCRRIITEVQDAELEAASALTKPFGKLKVHAPNGIGQYHIVPLIAKYSTLFPDVDFELVLSQKSPDLIAGAFDLMISSGSRVHDSSFIAQALGVTYSVLCAGAGYLAQRGVPNSIQDLAMHDCIGLNDPDFPSGWEFDGVDSGVVPGKERIRLNVANSMVQAAKENMGICLIPDYVAAEYVKSGQLIRVLPTLRAHSRTLSVVYPSRQYLDAKVRTWISFLKSHLPDRLKDDELFLQSPSRQGDTRLHEATM